MLKTNFFIKLACLSQVCAFRVQNSFIKGVNYQFSSIPKNPMKPPKPSLKEYQSIKSRQKQSLSSQKQISPSSSQQANQSHSNCRCEGCNTYLQFKDKKKYGYINQKVFNQAIQQNKNLVAQTYGQRVISGDAKVIDFLHEIQKETNIEIFSQESKNIEMKNLDNVSVLLTLQEKIDKYEEENQTLKKSKKIRKQLLCYRCHSLKYHNHLPQQYDDQIYEGGLNLDREFVIDKVFNKHKTYPDVTHFLFVVDALDVFGTLKQDLVFKLLEKGTPFSVVINKCDILNQKYLAQTLVHQQVKKLLKQYFHAYEKSLSSHTQFHNFSAEEKLKSIKIFFVSSVSRQGVKKIQQFMNEGIKRIQLFGLPNTGKTSLLNKLLNSDKITSKIPGTTIRVSQHTYRNRIKIFDMPGLHYTDLLYNLIAKPSLKSLLTWNKFYSPPLMTHSCYIYGGKIQAQGLRIVPFGLGGACSSDNRWFIMNYKEFWKGLPQLKKLNMVKHQHKLVFKDGKAQDLEISGYGFVSFKPCVKTLKDFQQKITFYLPEKITYRFRNSVLNSDNIFHNKSAFTKTHQLQRIQKQSNALA